MSRHVNLSGQRFGKLLVLEKIKNPKFYKRGARYLCECDCGNIKPVCATDMRRGHIKSCGCLGGGIFRDLTGQTFGRLLVIKRVRNNKKQTVFLCQCSCVDQTMVRVQSGNLLTGQVKSCGCLRKDIAKQKIKDLTGQKFFNLEFIEYSHSEPLKGPIWKCLCKCGKIKLVCSKEVKFGRVKSCGCRRFPSGPESHRWNKNLSDKDRCKKRKTYEYYEWQIGVKKKYNFICQKCFKHKRVLVSHHLDGYHWCTEKRFNIDNGICLCESCHYKFHKIYGNKNNTKIQFDEFVILKESNDEDKPRIGPRPKSWLHKYRQ